MELSGRIGIWGFGKEGQSLYQHLNTLGLNDQVTILLDNPTENNLPDTPILYGDKAMNAIKSGDFNTIFKSPGISLYRAEIEAAKSEGTKFSSATNLWFEDNSKTKKIVVTGTKGKSTTASLLYHVMKENGLSVSLGGNVGIPLLDLKNQTEYTVIELSSYQLADLDHTPDIFVVLNLFPEHLQWHQNHENYYNDKLRPAFINQSLKIIANADNDLLRERIAKTDNDIDWFKTSAKEKVETKLKGDHNQENISAILAVCKELNIDLDIAKSHIKTFDPLMHRLQEFKSKQGTTCVNDSISTTPETAIAAINVYQDNNLVLILGGTDRGQNYSELINKINSTNVKAIFLLPKNGERIKKQLNDDHFKGEITECESLEQVTVAIKGRNDPQEVVLLSPAAPSYDQFNNFEERGNLFIKLMQE